MLMSSCISTIGRICLMNFSIRNYSSGPIIGESHNICVFLFFLFFLFFFFSCPWAVPLSFSCFFTLFTLSIFYKSSLTGAFFMRFDTRTWVLSLVSLFLTAFDAEFGTYGFKWYLVHTYCALSGAQILYER